MTRSTLFSVRAALAACAVCAAVFTITPRAAAADIRLSGLLARAVEGQWPDFNEDGRLQPNEAAATTRIEISGRHIADLSDLKHFPNLEILGIYGNDAITRLDVSPFPRLLSLRIDSCKQLDQIDGLSSCLRLEEITITWTGLLSIDVRGLKALQVLDVQNNKLESIVSTGLTDLTILSDRNPLTGRNIDEARAAARVLDFSDNPALFAMLSKDSSVDSEGDDLITSGEADRVTDLNLNGDTLSSLKGLERFKNLKRLYVLDVRMETIDLRALPALEELELRLANLDERPVNPLKHLTVVGSPTLQRFELSESALESLTLSDLPALREIRAEHVARVKKLHLQGLPRLTHLAAKENPLTELSLEGLAQLEVLELYQASLPRLDLRGCPQLKTLTATDSGIRELVFDTLPYLERAILSRNELTRLDFTGIPRLRHLDLDENPLISLSVFGLRHLETLHANSASYAKQRAPTLTHLNLGGTVSLQAFSW